MSHTHFIRLAEEYHEANRTTRPIEIFIEPVIDKFEQIKLLEGMLCKDKIAAYLD